VEKNEPVFFQRCWIFTNNILVTLYFYEFDLIQMVDLKIDNNYDDDDDKNEQLVNLDPIRKNGTPLDILSHFIGF
jgi:hypothetical protein